jgi:hypothetical protein
MESVYHIVTVRVNETSWAHVWRLRSRYLGTGYDTSKREKIQENGKSQKCSFSQSHNPQNQHRKKQQDPAKKKQNTKSQTYERV